jgi:hypothetical protein
MSPVKGRPSRDNNGYSSSDDDDVNGAPMFAPRQSVDSRLELAAQVTCGLAFASVPSLLFLGSYHHLCSLLSCPILSLWLRHKRYLARFMCCLSILLPACLPLRYVSAVHLLCLPACLRVPSYLPFPALPLSHAVSLGRTSKPGCDQRRWCCRGRARPPSLQTK